MECRWPKAITPYNQAISYPKIPFVDEVEFTFSTNLVQLEPGLLMTFVHIDIYYWSPTMWRRLQSLWLSNRHLLPPIVYASGDVSDAKWAKFVTKLGFEPILENCSCSDGANRPIYAHFKKE
jgi:hypothetical protein